MSIESFVASAGLQCFNTVMKGHISSMSVLVFWTQRKGLEQSLGWIGGLTELAMRKKFRTKIWSRG